MNLRLIFLKACLIFTISLPMILVGCSEPQVDIEAEKVAVRAVWDEINEAFLAKDWNRYSKYFVQSPDFQMVHSAQSDWIDSWNSFQERYEPLVKAEGLWNFETIRFDVRISPLGDAAWAMVDFIFSAENGPEFKNYELVVFTKVEGCWKVASSLVAPSGNENNN
jgi:hypothetical protein